MTRHYPSWLVASALFGFVGCALVVGDLPEGRDPNAVSGGASGSGAASAGGGGGADGSAGAAGADASASGGAGGMSADSGAGGSSADASDGACCDCDGDGENGPQCQGKDCDDADPNVFSTQKKYFTTPSKTQGYDYDCNQSIEPEHGQVGCTLGLCNPNNKAFLNTPPPCGQTGDFGHCTFLSVTCNKVKEENKTQACR